MPVLMCKGAAPGWIRSCAIVSERARALPATGSFLHWYSPLFLLLVMAAGSELSGCGGGSVPVSASALPLTITTTALPSGHVGTAYATTLVATGGSAPYSWGVSRGSLAAGLTLAASTGAISGTPTTAVTASPVTFTVTDSGNPALTQSVSLSLTIAASTALAITTSSLPNGMVRGSYSATLAASGGIAPYSWSITSGTLPAGLVLSAATGAITGTPSAPVSATPLTFRVQDSSSTAQSA